MSLINDSNNIDNNRETIGNNVRDNGAINTESHNNDGMNMSPTSGQIMNNQSTPNRSKNIDPRAWQQAATQVNALLDAVSKAVIGQDTVVRQLCVCLLAGGHALIEGLPGLGKTLMVKAYAKAIGGSYHRVQFTPDLMPADITGHTLYDMQTGQWKVRRGPVFCNLLLADEINRASAKTQSALLEVMQEQQVTIEGTTYDVDQPFITIATQNPLEHEGTYPLPEAQLDRFLFNILIDYPDEQNEALMLKTVLGGHIGASLDLSQVPQIMSPERLLLLQKLTAQVSIDDRVIHYALQIIRATRQHHGIVAGSGPRGGIALLRAARANALLDSRHYVIPDDVVAVATPVLRHRIALSADYQIEGVRPEQVIAQILNAVPAPRQ
ncbi:AAA family ATPase [Psychrobacter sp. I-STPA10]|uniref:AAA family ATPase n=1 Tax=Psychrobacter sp. I-STPA10 TaxID=2585769 RepID=UPI001E4DDFCF|nr:MoxR family ATPase [Psychrobacter sp. I-STPA10]